MRSFDYFHTYSTSISLKKAMEYFYFYLFFHLCSYSVGVVLPLSQSSIFRLSCLLFLFSQCLLLQQWGSIWNTQQCVYCIYVHSCMSKTRLRRHFLKFGSKSCGKLCPLSPQIRAAQEISSHIPLSASFPAFLLS